MSQHRNRSLEVPPSKGRMGAVMAMLRHQGGMTKDAVIATCKSVGLVRGSIDRMLTYAKLNNLLLSDVPTLFDELPQIAPSQLPVLVLVPTMPANDAPQQEPTAPVEMSPPALVFLKDELARQLAVAWVACRGDESVWLAAAGIKPWLHGDALQLCMALKINGICRPGGTTDVLAMRYITTLASEPLIKRGRHHDKQGK